ncbi:sos function regulatory repressor [Leptolyngbya sp. Heron Island J]|uniref:LexA family protein n=1 Tax=Leptolyngbya sp. Heron Island J TaxID=1385935 RepID=UPI0003B9A65A|nr:S24 family peptidase [Leptolyngbya sp. Heron Island J]ESA35130.1 sos function regulatory repressor [Leptolyngbya sp. Heron Island J]
MAARKPHGAVLSFIEAYWRKHQNSPTIREIITGTERSHGSIQNSLNWLERNQYITRRKRTSRSIKLVAFESPALPYTDQSGPEGLPVRGEIAAGYCHEPATEEYERLNIEYSGRKRNDYVLKISGDSMVGAGIPDGAYVGIRPVTDGYKPKPGEIVAVYVEGQGATLKHFFQKESVVVLESANPKYEPMIFDLDSCELRVQGTHIFTHWQSAALC